MVLLGTYQFLQLTLFMELKIDGHLYLRICKFGIKHPEGFKIQTLLEELEIEDNSWEFLTINLYARLALLTARYNVDRTNNTITYNPEYDSLFHVLQRSNDSGGIDNFDITQSLDSIDIYKYYFILKASSVFEYLDYLEFTEAKENAISSLNKANESISIAIKSIRISFITLVISIIVSGLSIFISCKQLKISEKQLDLQSKPIEIDQFQLKQILGALDSNKNILNKNIIQIEHNLDSLIKTQN